MPKLSRGRDESTRKVSNLSEYLNYKYNVLYMTGLIGGKIYYDGRFWGEEEYAKAFPPVKLKINAEHIDGRQIEL